MTTRKLYEAYCLRCMDGGKSLGTFVARKSAERAATSHLNAYGCNVTILEQTQGATRVQYAENAS